MSVIVVTGVEGFLGWHARVHFHPHGERHVLGLSRQDLCDEAQLERAVRKADAVIHLAGVNRGADEEIECTNVDLARRLIAACDAGGARPHIVFANSTHRDRDTAYGRSKRRSAELLAEWSVRSGSIFTDVVIPNVFGEGGRPFYNSAIATFCHQLASGEKPRVIQDSELELIHAQDVMRHISKAIENRISGDLRLTGHRILVSECLDKLVQFDKVYRAHLVPDLSNDLDLDFFNAYRSYLFPKFYPVKLPLHADARGHLFEAIKERSGGQCFISTTKPGVTRGNHYHARKVERFLVLSGQAVIRLRKLMSREVVEFPVSGAVPEYIDMPTFHTHSITNIGSTDLMTLFWAHEIYDPQRSDTIREPVEIR